MAKRVVVLSEDLGATKSLIEDLAAQGYEVHSHVLDENSLVFAKEKDPSAIVLDSSREWEEVSSLVRDIKREFALRNTSIIVAALPAKAQDRPARLAIHNVFLVDHPIDPDKLTSILRNAIGKAA